MRLGRGPALGRLLEDLGDGDPVAWGVVAVCLAVVGGIGLWMLKLRRDFAREDEARAKRYRRG